MKTWNRILSWSVAALTVWGSTSWAQEVEPPFNWKGKGVASLMAEYGINEVNFSFELAVDASGGIKGKTSSSEGTSSIKHVFYGERVDHELPGYYSRKAILVLMINEDSGDPIVAVLDGRLLAGRFFTSEVLIKRSEPGSAADKALGVGDPMATPIDGNDLPSDLKSALKKCLPFGAVKIEGAYGR